MDSRPPDQGSVLPAAVADVSPVGGDASLEDHRVSRKDVRTAVASSTIGTTIEWYD